MKTLEPDPVAPPSAPLLRVGKVLDNADGKFTVTIPSYDNGAGAITAFGHWPDAEPGDPVRVYFDERNDAVVVAWEPAP